MWQGPSLGCPPNGGLEFLPGETRSYYGGQIAARLQAKYEVAGDQVKVTSTGIDGVGSSYEYERRGPRHLRHHRRAGRYAELDDRRRASPLRRRAVGGSRCRASTGGQGDAQRRPLLLLPHRKRPRRRPSRSFLRSRSRTRSPRRPQRPWSRWPRPRSWRRLSARCKPPRRRLRSRRRLRPHKARRLDRLMRDGRRSVVVNMDRRCDGSLAAARRAGRRQHAAAARLDL